MLLFFFTLGFSVNLTVKGKKPAYGKKFINVHHKSWIGEYENDVKVGEWKLYQGWQHVREYSQEKMQFEAIGGGSYDKQGFKIGKWKEVEEKQLQEYSPQVSNYSVLCKKICQEGQYIANIKVGQWRTMFYYGNDKAIQIGGGFYDEKGLKKGWWIEVVEDQFYKRLFWEGKYTMGTRVGSWKLFEQKMNNQPHELDSIIILGEGDFNITGNKVGQWKDVKFRGQNQCFIWEGKYNQGIKVGAWKIFYYQTYQQDFYQRQLIGGGEFNEVGEKIGEWEEINENYYDQNLKIIQKGFYKFGRRVGLWKLFYQQNQTLLQYELGYYDDSGQKVGLWRDINEKCFKKNEQIFNSGMYNLGIKQGRWNILYKNQNIISFEIVGGGLYNQKGQKKGVWREIQEDAFTKKIKIVWEGRYLDGLRIGLWKIFYSEYFEEFQEIGGGEYDNQGLKIGKWKETDENCYNSKIKITWEGEYQAGIRVGNWNVSHRESNFSDFRTIERMDIKN